MEDEEYIPTVEELQSDGKTIKEIAKEGTSHVMLIKLTPQEYEKIGGNSDAMNKLTRRVAEEVTRIIEEEY
jgi:hypothetical protein